MDPATGEYNRHVLDRLADARAGLRPHAGHRSPQGRRALRGQERERGRRRGARRSRLHAGQSQYRQRDARHRRPAARRASAFGLRRADEIAQRRRRRRASGARRLGRRDQDRQRSLRSRLHPAAAGALRFRRAHARASSDPPCKRFASCCATLRSARSSVCSDSSHRDHGVADRAAGPRAARSGRSRIASRFDHEKHFAAASRHGSHACRRCSRGSRVHGNAARAAPAPNTCSVLCVDSRRVAMTPAGKDLVDVGDIANRRRRRTARRRSRFPPAVRASRSATSDSPGSWLPVTDCQ